MGNKSTHALVEPLVARALADTNFEPHRSQRDRPFALALAIAWAINAYIAYHALREGDANRLLGGIDTHDNLCGRDLPKRPYLYFSCLQYGTRQPAICVSECPRLSGSYVRWYNGSIISCELHSRAIPATTYPTTNLLGNCVPSSAALYQLVADEIDSSAPTSILQGILKGSSATAMALLASAACSALYVVLIRRLAPRRVLPIVTVSLAAAGLVLLSAMLWYNFAAAVDWAEDNPVIQGSLQVAASIDMSVGLAAFSSCFSLAVGMALSCGLLTRLLQTGGVLREAADALTSLPALLFVLPPLLTLGVVCLWCYWVVISLYIATAGTPGGGMLHYDRSLQACFVLHTLVVLWTVEALLHLGFCASSGLVVRWYFGAPPDHEAGGTAALGRALGRTLRFSSGSLALGALMVVPGRPFRFFLEHCLHQAQTDGSGKAELRGITQCCLRCCLDVATRYLQYMSHNAYIVIAAHDVGFLEGARQAFELTLSSIGSVALLTAGERLLLTLAKLAIAAATTTLAASLLSSSVLSSLSVADNTSGCLIFCFIASFSVADAWLLCFDAAIEAIFLCFLVDHAENDGETRPYYASAKLRAYMELHRPAYTLPMMSLDDDEHREALAALEGLDAKGN